MMEMEKQYNEKGYNSAKQNEKAGNLKFQFHDRLTDERLKKSKSNNDV